MIERFFRTHALRLIAALAVCAALSTTACPHTRPIPDFAQVRRPLPTVPIDPAVVQAGNLFGFGLLHAVDSPGGNTFLSPLSRCR
jgi:hypothetical protein